MFRFFLERRICNDPVRCNLKIAAKKIKDAVAVSIIEDIGSPDLIEILS